MCIYSEMIKPVFPSSPVLVWVSCSSKLSDFLQIPAPGPCSRISLTSDMAVLSLLSDILLPFEDRPILGPVPQEVWLCKLT